MRRTLADVLADRRIGLEEAEALLNRMETATRSTEVAALQVEFGEVCDQVEAINQDLEDYYNRRDERWRTMLRRAYGYVPK